MFSRKQVPEVAVQGLVALRQLDGGTFSNAPTNLQFVTRSLLKPWQYLAADVGNREPFWALAFASHSAQPPQIDALQKLASEAGVNESSLICPRAWPLDAMAAMAMRMKGETQTRLLHPCSGKHLALLAACRHHGHPVEQYFSPDHPVQKRLYNLVGREAGERLEWLTDSCGLPVAAMSVDGYLGLWDKLAKSNEPRVQDLKALWLANPRLVGGVKRFDSDLMEAFPGRLLAKEGADGLLVVHMLPVGGEGPATCFVKVSAGYNQSHLALALLSLLQQSQRNHPLGKSLGDLNEYLRSRQDEWIPGDQNLSLAPFA
ncbi:MAG: hypothetical protein RIQ81_884 [Pseudomonadota bacterium]|jgi:L-asparaginase II